MQNAATLNNRALIEIGMLRTYRKISMSNGISKTVDNHLLMGRDSLMLSKHSKQVCQDLAQYDFALDERSVAKELSVLMHEISKSLHRQAFLPNEPPGYYVGGSPPFAQAVACMITYLQKQDLITSDLMVYLIDGSKKPRCKLHKGKVLPLMAPHRCK